MFTSVVLGTNDLIAAKAFYDAALAALNISEGFFNEAKQRVLYRTDSGLLVLAKPIDNKPATVGNGCTFGFKCGSEQQAKAFHDAGVAHGGKSIEDPPGWRELGDQRVYLAYLRDVDGHKLSAVYRSQRLNP